MEKYSNLTDEQIALICAKDIVEAQIRKDWDFSGDDTPQNVTLYLANYFYQFLKNPTWEGFLKTIK